MISILTVTFNRPQWWPWLFHQVDKQLGSEPYEHIVVDGGRDERLFNLCETRPHTVYVPSTASIPVQRNAALRSAHGHSIVWFDDDDWQCPGRLASSSFAPVVANRWAPVVSAHNPDQCERQGYEPFIFNSACVSRAVFEGVAFNERFHTDEDIDWIRRLRIEEYVILTEPLFAWMSHASNVTNSNKGRLFEDQTQVRLDSKERALLKEITRG